MIQFLICLGLMGLFTVPTILMIIICGVDAKHKIIGSAIVLVFWLLISGAMIAKAQHDFDTYNNGVCVACGGEYKFRSATQYRTSHYYYYTCENCDHTIELNSLMK